MLQAKRERAGVKMKVDVDKERNQQREEEKPYLKIHLFQCRMNGNKKRGAKLWH